MSKPNVVLDRERILPCRVKLVIFLLSFYYHFSLKILLFLVCDALVPLALNLVENKKNFRIFQSTKIRISIFPTAFE